MDFLTPEILTLGALVLTVIGGYVKIEKRMTTLEVHMKMLLKRSERGQL